MDYKLHGDTHWINPTNITPGWSRMHLFWPTAAQCCKKHWSTHTLSLLYPYKIKLLNNIQSSSRYISYFLDLFDVSNSTCVFTVHKINIELYFRASSVQGNTIHTRIKRLSNILCLYFLTMCSISSNTNTPWVVATSRLAGWAMAVIPGCFMSHSPNVHKVVKDEKIRMAKV